MFNIGSASMNMIQQIVSDNFVLLETANENSNLNSQQDTYVYQFPWLYVKKTDLQGLFLISIGGTTQPFLQDQRRVQKSITCHIVKALKHAIKMVK